MSEYITDSAALTHTADRIRAKTGGTNPITWDAAKGFGDAVDAIPAGGGADAIVSRITGSITAYSNDTITTMSGYSFASCAELASVDLPKVKVIKHHSFLDCIKLANLNLPALQRIEHNTFRNCRSITEFITTSNFNSRLDRSTFEGCSGLEKADFYKIDAGEGISGYALACANLVALIIRNTDAVPKANSDIFGGASTKMNTGEGYIYVPATMVASYKAATNWSKYADQIRAIEDYPDITGG